jgi:hypothetical protein
MVCPVASNRQVLGFVKLKIKVLHSTAEYINVVNTFDMVAVLIASVCGTVLGLVLAYGVAGQKVADRLFISARRACNMEAHSINSADLEKSPEKSDSKKA